LRLRRAGPGSHAGHGQKTLHEPIMPVVGELGLAV
jgi:hypothetical protein